MSYTKQNFEDGQVLRAEHLNKMEEGIEKACKPFVTVGGDTLEWDGNTDGREFVDISGGGGAGYVHVSDATPTVGDLANGGLYKTYSNEGGVGGAYFTSDGVDASYEPFIQVQMVLIVPTDNATMDVYTFPKKGIYFFCDPNNDIRVSTFQINGYTGFTKEQIDPAVLPEALQFGDKEYTVLYEGTGLEPDPEDGLVVPVDFKFVVGNQYAVVVDGVEYTTTAVNVAGLYIVIGNLSMLGVGDDNGLPFFSIVDGGNLCVAASSNFSSLTISSVEVKKIDEQYLPNAVLLYFDDDKYLYPTSDTSDTSKRLTVVQLNAFVNSGMSIYVCYNGAYRRPFTIIFAGDYGMIVTIQAYTPAFSYSEYYTAEYTAS